MGEGDDTPLGEQGDISLGVCALDGGFDGSESSAMDRFLDLAPIKLFFCLNFSSQVLLLALIWLSELPTEAAKNWAFSLIMSSVRGSPCRWWFFAQFAKALSTSGNLLFDLLIGERLPSSWYKYFSFCLRTLDTVLEQSAF